MRSNMHHYSLRTLAYHMTPEERQTMKARIKERIQEHELELNGIGSDSEYAAWARDYENLKELIIVLESFKGEE